MSQAALKYATYDDLLDLPNDVIGEILNGTLHIQPRPAPKHALAYSVLGFLIGGPFHSGISGPGGWWILDEPELHLGAQILVPDLAGWRRERMPAIPDTAWFELVPDWVCEILSPSTLAKDRAIKMPIYAREGVEYVWLVDPQARTLEVYHLQDGGRWLLLATLQDDAPVSQPPFDAVTFPLNALWTD